MIDKEYKCDEMKCDWCGITEEEAEPDTTFWNCYDQGYICDSCFDKLSEEAWKNACEFVLGKQGG